jgi:hypothetical protein
MLQGIKNTKTHQPPPGPAPLPPAPTLRPLHKLTTTTVSNPKILEGRAIRLTTTAIANTQQHPQQTNPLAPREVTLLIERATPGSRGGVEGKILLDPRDRDPRLSSALNHAGMKWLYEGEVVFLPLLELRAGFSIIDCQVATAPEATKWMARAIKMIDRHKKGLPPNKASLLESISGPAKVGIAGASLAGALIGYKLYTDRAQQPDADEATTTEVNSPPSEFKPKSILSNATIDPKLRSIAVPAAKQTNSSTD